MFFILFLSTTLSSAWQSITDMVHLLWIACKYTRRGQRALLLCDIPNDKDLVVIVQWNQLSDSGGHETDGGGTTTPYTNQSEEGRPRFTHRER